jgi:hypothetical protein
MTASVITPTAPAVQAWSAVPAGIAAGSSAATPTARNPSGTKA